ARRRARAAPRPPGRIRPPRPASAPCRPASPRAPCPHFPSRAPKLSDRLPCDERRLTASRPLRESWPFIARFEDDMNLLEMATASSMLGWKTDGKDRLVKVCGPAGAQATEKYNSVMGYVT